MIATIMLSIGIVFLAELGDKSQLMALTFALRYRWWVVLLGIATASAAVHLISVGVGYFLGSALPTRAIALVAAITFLLVGLWTLRENLTAAGEEEAESDAKKSARRSTAPFLIVMSAFLLAELGDRTMFATAALATDYDWVGVWIGSTVGMVTADALAIALGIVLGKHLPERLIGIGSGLLFLFFGTMTLISTIDPNMGGLLAGGLAAILPVLIAVVLALRSRANRAALPRTDHHCAAPDPAAVPAAPADRPGHQPRSGR